MTDLHLQKGMQGKGGTNKGGVVVGWVPADVEGADVVDVLGWPPAGAKNRVLYLFIENIMNHFKEIERKKENWALNIQNYNFFVQFAYLRKYFNHFILITDFAI